MKYYRTENESGKMLQHLSASKLLNQILKNLKQ